MSRLPGKSCEFSVEVNDLRSHYDITFHLDGCDVAEAEEAWDEAQIAKRAAEKEVVVGLSGRYTTPFEVLLSTFIVATNTPRTYMRLSDKELSLLAIHGIHPQEEPGKGYRGLNQRAA